jgi:hypothetical protein
VGLRRVAAGSREGVEGGPDKGTDSVSSDPRSDRLVLLLPTESKLRTLSVDLASLTAWSIAGRYPADATDATRTDAENALRDARVVLNVAGEALGDAMESEVSVADEAQPHN